MGGHLLGEHDRAVAGAAAGEQGVERTAGWAGGAEDPVVDLVDMAGAADDEAFGFVGWVSLGVRVGFVLSGEVVVGWVGHVGVREGRVLVFGTQLGVGGAVWGLLRAAHWDGN